MSLEEMAKQYAENVASGKQNLNPETGGNDFYLNGITSAFTNELQKEGKALGQYFTQGYKPTPGTETPIVTMGDVAKDLYAANVQDFVGNRLSLLQSPASREHREELTKVTEAAANLAKTGELSADTKLSDLTGADAELLQGYYAEKANPEKHELDQIQMSKSGVRSARANADAARTNELINENQPQVIAPTTQVSFEK